MEALKTIEIFQNHSEPLNFEAGQEIFKSGETGHLIYGIESGEVEMQIEGKTLEILKHGDVFGAGALVHRDRLRDYTAVAKTECQILTLDEKRFLFAVQQTPMFALEVMRSFSDRLRRLKKLVG